MSSLPGFFKRREPKSKLQWRNIHLNAFAAHFVCVFGVAVLRDVVDLIVTQYRPSCCGWLDRGIPLSSKLLRNICLVIYLDIGNEDLRKERRRYFLAPLQLIAELDGRLAGVDVSHMVAIEPKSVDDLGDATRPFLPFSHFSNS